MDLPSAVLRVENVRRLRPHRPSSCLPVLAPTRHQQMSNSWHLSKGKAPLQPIRLEHCSLHAAFPSLAGGPLSRREAYFFFFCAAPAYGFLAA